MTHTFSFYTRPQLRSDLGKCYKDSGRFCVLPTSSYKFEGNIDGPQQADDVPMRDSLLNVVQNCVSDGLERSFGTGMKFCDSDMFNMSV